MSEKINVKLMASFHTLSMSVPVAQEEMRVSQGKVCETQMHSPFHALLPDLLSPPHQNYKTNTLQQNATRNDYENSRPPGKNGS